MQIATHIPHDDETAFLQAFQSYLDMLDGFEKLRDDAVDRVPSVVQQPDVHPNSQDDNVSTASQRSHAAVDAKRTRAEDSDDESHPSKRKVDVSAFTWYQAKPAPPSIQSRYDLLQKTQSALENFGRDLKFTLLTVVNSFDCPQFPESEWKNILAGRAVNLDHVLSSLFSVSQEVKHTEQVGDFEIALGSTSPSKMVKTHGDWNIAWDATIEATAFVLPHRRLELADYRRFIIQEFAANPPEAQPYIISYDSAIRVRVAQRRNLLLTDFDSFRDIQTHWIGNTPWRGSTLHTSSDKRTDAQVKRKREACRRWNEGRCPNSHAACNYKHVCSKCGKNTHTGPECTKP
jgi:hypothetical protein